MSELAATAQGIFFGSLKRLVLPILIYQEEEEEFDVLEGLALPNCNKKRRGEEAMLEPGIFRSPGKTKRQLWKILLGIILLDPLFSEDFS